MEVLFYQGLIFLTLVLVRIISPKHLVAACVIWTILTLVNLFWPPLIGLQLIVIWGTYNLIRPKKPSASDAVQLTRRDEIVRFPRLDESIAEATPQKVQVDQKFQNSERGLTPDPLRQRALNVTEIQSEARKRGIPHLVHFTRCENLSSIVQHGLHSVAGCRAMGIDAFRNDKIRLDGKLDGTSLSVTFPNYRMFYKYRQLDKSADWAVLILSSRIIWEKECGFFKNNAADSRMRALPREQTMTPQALREMFEDFEEPRKSWLRSYDPSDPQAEVIVYSSIEPSLIETVAFETEAATEKWAHVLGGIDTICAGHGKGLFGTRAQVRGV
ncbi:MAG: DarT ssDNA thymidine ADP-ribosyltransferase family protein [Hyphomonas sp.]